MRRFWLRMRLVLLRLELDPHEPLTPLEHPDQHDVAALHRQIRRHQLALLFGKFHSSFQAAVPRCDQTPPISVNVHELTESIWGYPVFARLVYYRFCDCVDCVVRLPALDPVGARVRTLNRLKTVEIKGGIIEVTSEVLMEAECQQKPCCVAESLARYVF